METTDFVSYDLALKLKACGFEEPCIAQWACEPDGKPILVGSTAFVFSNAELKGRDVTAPLLYHAQKWLREKKELFIEVSPNFGMRARATFGITSHEFTLFDSRGHIINDMDRSTYPSYEAALSAGISAALELIKKGE